MTRTTVPRGVSLRRERATTRSNRSSLQEGSIRNVLLLPSIGIVLLLSIFPLIASLFLSFSRVNFARGGVEIAFVGFSNYQKLLFGSQQRHLLGKFGDVPFLGWLIIVGAAGLMFYWWYRSLVGGKARLQGVILRLIAAIITSMLVWICVSTLTGDGLPGTMVVTLIFVFVGVFIQYSIGLLLALLLVQNLPGKRLFRIVFLLPMMITPVGIAFLFRMLADTHVGPLAPLLNTLGLGDVSWVSTPEGARTAVLIGDIWQWTPFMFIILLAALEGTSKDQLEAAHVDGATRLQIFRFIILPQIAPVSLTLILIRLLEAFKIIDIPRILTGGGPGTATETLTMHSYIEWRSPNLGGSAAISYLLLLLVTFVAIMFVNVIRQQIIERL
ncbi:MAG: sugar ABC transporter permease [Caldilineaceae bacterium]|nr:sugar ABC transporter permease [Caldilineaceae bacterium]